MSKVDWTKWSAIAEITSSAAILLTLVYLALQTQQLAIQNQQLVIQTGQNTAAIQATVRQAILAEDRALLQMQMDYPIVYPGSYDEAALTDEERVRLYTWLTVFARGRENQWLQFQNGVLDEATWKSYAAAIPIVLGPDLAYEHWQATSRRGDYDSGFVAYVEELFEE